jgi:transposase InsO family protein
MRQQGVSMVRACQRWELARSTAYYRPRPVAAAPWEARLAELAQAHPAYGYRKVLHLLRREGWTVNAKSCYRRWRDRGLAQRPPRSGRRHHRPAQPFDPVIPQRAGHVWALDFIHDRLTSGRPFRILNVLDLFSRRALEPLVDVSLPGTAVRDHLRRLFQREGPPAVLRRDDGPELGSRAVQLLLAQWHVADELIPPGQPYDNGHMESFHSSQRRECLDRELFDDIGDARMVVCLWTLRYNEERPHQALAYRTPQEVWNESKGSDGNTHILPVQLEGAGPGRPNISSV